MLLVLSKDPGMPPLKLLLATPLALICTPLKVDRISWLVIIWFQIDRDHFPWTRIFSHANLMDTISFRQGPAQSVDCYFYIINAPHLLDSFLNWKMYTAISVKNCLYNYAKYFLNTFRQPHFNVVKGKVFNWMVHRCQGHESFECHKQASLLRIVVALPVTKKG